MCVVWIGRGLLIDIGLKCIGQTFLWFAFILSSLSFLYSVIRTSGVLISKENIDDSLALCLAWPAIGIMFYIALKYCIGQPFPVFVFILSTLGLLSSLNFLYFMDPTSGAFISMEDIDNNLVWSMVCFGVGLSVEITETLYRTAIPVFCVHIFDIFPTNYTSDVFIKLFPRN